ncbi:hypothetical protein ACJRO7_022984 [Eucalyptus globulus]|uniref:Protein kinase domain-containing protein n=1 Tax=Eucalyptus globulus TaxID=34317 RepID=A0ABD3K2Q9_EUCGL
MNRWITLHLQLKLLKPLASQWGKGQLIGCGTFGSVYIASNCRLNFDMFRDRETRVLGEWKEFELLPNDPNLAECMRQFKQEIQVLSQLRHPNILQYYGSEIVEDQLNVYLEYAHHGSIDKYIKERLGTLTESVVRTFTYDIVTGLASLHVNNSIHG